MPQTTSPSPGVHAPAGAADGYREVFELLPYRVCVLDQYATVVAVNQAWADATTSVDDPCAVGDHVPTALRAGRFVPADLRHEAARLVERVCAGRSRSESFELPTSDGGNGWSRYVVAAVGEYFLLHVQDVTDEIAARTLMARAAEEARWMGLVARSITDGVVVMDADGRVEWANDAYLAMTGYGLEELVGRATLEVLAERGIDVDDLYRAVGTVRSADTDPVRLQIRGRTKDGRSLTEDLQVIPLVDSDGNIVRFVGIARDITELDVMQHELAQERHLLASILEHLPLGVVWKDIDGRYLGCNETFARQVGVPREKFLGCTVEELFPESFGSSVAASDAEVLASGQAQLDVERPVALPDGSSVTMSTSRIPMREDDGTITGILALARDVTELRRLERRLSDASRMEAVGNLAAGVAHELNTPLQYLADNIEFLTAAVDRLLSVCNAAAQDRSALPPLVRAALDECRFDYLAARVPKALSQSAEGIGAMSAIVRAMKRTSHPGSAVRELANINEELEATVLITRSEWKYVAAMELDLCPDAPLVPVYGTELKQVFINLLVNAAHAVADRYGPNGAEHGRIRLRTGVDGDSMVVSFSDNGCGISAEHRDKIFDLFFTTKEVGRGTGQGLAFAQACIVGRHGGAIDVDSTEGEGATFTLRLPLRSAGDDTAPSGAEAVQTAAIGVHEGRAHEGRAHEGRATGGSSVDEGMIG